MEEIIEEAIDKIENYLKDTNAPESAYAPLEFIKGYIEGIDYVNQNK